MEIGPWNGTSFIEAGLFWAGNTERPDGGVTRPASPRNIKGNRKHSNRVLMLGRLRELALYRVEVLRHHGFEVSAPETEQEALSAIEQGNFDVAILSYTLLDREVRQFVELIRQRCPDSPILAITQTSHYDRRIEPDSVVIADKGPAELVMALRRLLGSR